jgi:hypothetical protein
MHAAVTVQPPKDFVRCLQSTGNLLFVNKKNVTSVSLGTGLSSKVQLSLKSSVAGDGLLVQCSHASLVDLNEAILQSGDLGLQPDPTEKT